MVRFEQILNVGFHFEIFSGIIAACHCSKVMLVTVNLYGITLMIQQSYFFTFVRSPETYGSSKNTIY